MAFQKTTAEEAKAKAVKRTVSTTPLPTVRVTLLENARNTAAMVSLYFGDFCVTGIAVVWSPAKQKFFISYPNRPTKSGEYKDICFPTTKECRTFINELIIKALQEADKETEWNF